MPSAADLPVGQRAASTQVPADEPGPMERDVPDVVIGSAVL